MARLARHLMCFGLALACLNSLAQDEQTFVGQYDQAVNDDRLSEAIALIKGWNPKSKLRPWSVVEGGKILYRQGKWAEFFGVAFYSRVTYPQSPETEKIRLLELLALIRHCQFEKAAVLYHEFAEMKPSPENERDLKIIGDWLAVVLGAKFQKTAADRSQKKPTGIFQKTNFWQLSLQASEVKSLDPFAMRRVIKPQCLSRKAAR